MDQTNRYETQIYTRDSLKQIANLVASSVGRKLTDNETRDLLNFVSACRTKDWNGRSNDRIRQTLVQNYLALRFTEIGRTATRHQTDIIDMHELLKQHMGSGDDNTPDAASSVNVNEDGFITDGSSDPNATVTDSTVDTPSGLGNLGSVDSINTISTINTISNVQQIFGQSNFNSVIAALNPSGATRKNYILFDTRYRSQDTDGVTSFGWNFLSNSNVNTPGAINSLGDVKNVTAIKVYPIKIPYMDVLVNNSYNRVTMLINEFSGQAFIGQEGRKFHFIFESEVDENMIKLTPLPHPTGIFEFAKPISSIDTLTLTFGMPLESVTFDPDRGAATVQYTNPAQFTMTNNMPHNLQTGDQVYISGFTSNNTVVDYTAINVVNAINGYNVYVVDPFTFQIQVDLTTITAPIANIVVSVYFGSKRIYIPMELWYMAGSTPAQNTSF